MRSGSLNGRRGGRSPPCGRMTSRGEYELGHAEREVLAEDEARRQHEAAARDLEPVVGALDDEVADLDAEAAGHHAQAAERLPGPSASWMRRST